MRKIMISIFIICLYCFPFVSFSMYQDFSNGSMFGYLIMIIGTSILAFFSKLYINKVPFIIGNIASALISYYVLHQMNLTLGVGWDDGYFSPLTPFTLLLFVSFLNLIPQFFSMLIARNLKTKQG